MMDHRRRVQQTAARLDKVCSLSDDKQVYQQEGTMRIRLVTVWILCGLTAIAAGCTSYYRVTDPASGKSYYTTEISESGRAGAVKIKDAKSGGTITLQSSEVKEISEDEYKAGISAKTPPPK
jgi:hypothetical protein